MLRSRTPEELRQHYLAERELAERLRRASRDERPRLYRDVYDELFRRVPDHPQLLAARDPRHAEWRQRSVERELRFLGPYLGAQRVFMEIGAGDCALSLRAAALARRVYAIDVSEQITGGAEARPSNFELLLTEGTRIPVADGAVDVAYSNQLMEHLHPEDAREQLRNIFAALAPGGLYVCITPNRLDGPHDVSRSFSEEPEGFHLKEYTVTELEALFLATGFRRIASYARTKGICIRVPLAMIRALEAVLHRMPFRKRRTLANRWPLRRLLNPGLVATK